MVELERLAGGAKKIDAGNGGDSHLISFGQVGLFRHSSAPIALAFAQQLVLL